MIETLIEFFKKTPKETKNKTPEGVCPTDLVNPNFAEYANSCGALGIQVTDKSKLKSALQQILDHKGPALLEINTDVGLI